MSGELMIVFGALLVVLLVGLLAYWLLVTTEGVYLGQRVVVWLYDRTAGRYDQIKEFDDEFEAAFLARPLLTALGPALAPRILDVATGTGRLPWILLNEPTFNGRITGLDPSHQMLAVAVDKLRPFRDRVGWVQGTAVPLPFPDDYFDAVTCVEALEFLPDETAAIREMMRVLRPGGTVLLTRRTGREARLFPGRYRSREGMISFLSGLGWRAVRVEPWQLDYDQVFAQKPARGGQRAA